MGTGVPIVTGPAQQHIVDAASFGVTGGTGATIAVVTVGEPAAWLARTVDALVTDGAEVPIVTCTSERLKETLSVRYVTLVFGAIVIVVAILGSAKAASFNTLIIAGAKRAIVAPSG